MYSGTTLHGKSGNLMGAHQKFDRVARRFVKNLRPEAVFPPTKLILHFEGNNGPDGIKRKSAGKDEPWHFWNPNDKDDRYLLDVICTHYEGLVKGLKKQNYEKVAFEAAWMAHAIVDGLTPPHHYPYEQKLSELRGEGKETRTSVKSKIVIKGDTRLQTLSKNWRVWGAKGLLMSHAFFEFGVSATVRPLKLANGLPTEAEIKHARNIGFELYYTHLAQEIYGLKLYERFLKYGWTNKIVKQIRQELGPTMVRAITIAWILAIDEANV
jgi:hypothetical protein